MQKLLLPISIVVAGVIIAGAFVYINQGKVQEPTTEETLSSQQIAEKVIDYINKNKETLTGGDTASLLNITEEGSVYKIRLKIGENEFDSYVTKDGKFLFPGGYNLEETQEEEKQPESQEEKAYTIGNFLVSEDEVCKEDGKPIIYFFGSESCPHCRWEHPIIENVASKFKENIVFHNNMDSREDMDIFSKYSTGGIPTLVFGCKYYRVGSGERMGEEEEFNVLTALICKLTQNQPAGICNTVQDLISQIK